MTKIKPQNTAISRKGPSAPARTALKFILEKFPSGGEKILDYGCGRGADVLWLRSLGFTAFGYDPNPAFGFNNENLECCQVVLMTYVVNIIPNYEDRVQAVQQAWTYVTPGGYLIVTSRNCSVISREAHKGCWAFYNDGFKTRGSFQKGHDLYELRELFEGINWAKEFKSEKIKDATQIIFQKRN